MHKDFNDFLSAKGVNKEEFSKKSAEDQAGLFNEYNDQVRAEISSLKEKGASKEDVETLKNELKENLVAQQKALNETLKEYGLAIKVSFSAFCCATKFSFNSFLRVSTSSRCSFFFKA